MLENMNITIGETNLKSSTGYAEIRKATKIVFHPKVSQDKRFDVALIKVGKL